MFTIPDRIIKEPSDTSYNTPGATELNTQIQQGLNQMGISYTANNYSRKSAVTTNNPFIKLIYFLLIYKNSDNAKPLSIIEDTLSLTPNQQINLNSILGHLNGPKLVIYRITKGSQYLKEQNFDEFELKLYSTNLQRSGQHRIRVTRPDRNTVVIFTNVWNHELAYKITALLPRFFPAYYTFPETSTKAMEVIKAICRLDKNAFEETLRTWETITEYHCEQNDSQLALWLQSVKRQTLENITRSLNQTQSAITSLETNLEELYNNMQFFLTQQNDARAQFNNTNEEATKELLDYLNNNKSIVDYAWRDNKLNLKIISTLEYIDTAALSNVLNNWNKTDSDYAIFKALFLNPNFEKYRIILCADINVGLSPPSVSATTVGDSPPNTLNSPHLYNYNCWGNNRQIITNALAKGDIIVAFEQIIAATKHLNILDSTVVNTFRNAIKYNTHDSSVNKCVKNMETGETLTLYELHQLIKKEGEQNNEAN